MYVIGAIVNVGVCLVYVVLYRKPFVYRAFRHFACMLRKFFVNQTRNYTNWVIPIQTIEVPNRHLKFVSLALSLQNDLLTIANIDTLCCWSPVKFLTFDAIPIFTLSIDH